ncbi:NAD(P)-dependent alcohol dehydrogenase [Acidobacteria bacterium AH-259-D05]|nr:NAD(P)-dependent alcohol dehydrogenase [Acidobacteria bacterium AH-259-D05]
MKAIQIRQYGSSDVLEYVDRGRPIPAPHQYLVKVHCAGVNPIDWKIRKGMMKFLLRTKLPFVPGFDICGEVVETGGGVSKFKPGDWIYGELHSKRGGGYAEYAVVDEAFATPKPEELSPCEAAALPGSALTAVQALRDTGRLRSGQQVLIIGASGGVGHFAVQIAKAMSAQVTAVCGTDNVDWVRDLGADRVIDYRKEDYRKEALRYDIVFDAVAVDSYWVCSSLLTPRGVYVRTLPSAGLFLSIVISPLVSGKRARFVVMKPSGEDLRYLNRLVQTGQLRPVIGQVYPFAEAKAAQDHSEGGHARGKIVLQVLPQLNAAS